MGYPPCRPWASLECAGHGLTIFSWNVTGCGPLSAWGHFPPRPSRYSLYLKVSLLLQGSVLGSWHQSCWSRRLVCSASPCSNRLPGHTESLQVAWWDTQAQAPSVSPQPRTWLSLCPGPFRRQPHRLPASSPPHLPPARLCLDFPSVYLHTTAPRAPPFPTPPQSPSRSTL